MLCTGKVKSRKKCIQNKKPHPKTNKVPPFKHKRPDTRPSRKMSKSLLPVPVFHDDHLSHSFKQANDSFRNRQRPPKLYPKHNHHHHHHQHQLHHLSLPQQPPQPQPQQYHHQSLNGQPSAPQYLHLQQQLNHTCAAAPYAAHTNAPISDSTSVFNKSMSTSSVATSVSFVGPAGGAPVVVTHRPLCSPHYRSDRNETYFEQCFVVLARLGEGSFSEVFRVRSRDDGHEYAVKRSKQPYKSERYREERLEEVRRYEQLARTEHCLRLHFAWEQDDHLYMQLELCRESVDAFVLRQRRPLDEQQVWRILADLLLGIRALHSRNLIHLDVKLENIMMDERGQCKLGDFGLVVDLNKPNLHQSCEGDSRYIAPELMQARFTKAADVFSFGITALELVCNLALPNNGPLWVQLRNGELPACLDGCSEEMQSLVRRSMCPAYQERPNVDELLQYGAVQRVLRQRRHMRPLRAVAQMPRLAARLWRRMVYYARVQFAWLAVRLFAVFSLTAADRDRGQCVRGAAPNTPHRCANGGGPYASLLSQSTPSWAISSRTPSISSSPLALTSALQSQQQLQSTPSWPRTARQHHLLDEDDDDCDDVYGPAAGTPQLLLLDDSEIESSPRTATKQTKAAMSALAAGIANSTPLTTHVLGGFRKSRREVSASSFILNDSNHNNSAYLDGTSPLRAGDSKSKSGCTNRKKLFCNNSDDSN